MYGRKIWSMFFWCGRGVDDVSIKVV